MEYEGEPPQGCLDCHCNQEENTTIGDYLWEIFSGSVINRDRKDEGAEELFREMVDYGILFLEPTLGPKKSLKQHSSYSVLRSNFIMIAMVVQK